MTGRGKFIFAGCIIAHFALSWFSMAWCTPVSMAILDNGGTEAPPSLVVMCWTEVICSLPLMPLTRPVFGRLMTSGLPEHHAIYWVLVLINSFVAISIIFLVARAVAKLMHSRRARLAT
jgi:hypothetical protein